MKKLLAALLVLVLFVSAAFTFAESWTCPSCGREGNDGNFCPTCDTAKPDSKLICSVCGAEFNGDVDYIYCPYCATPLRQDSLQTVFVGDVVTFGSYPQKDHGMDRTPIEWIVLDVQEGKALLLSKYGLEAKMYNTVQKDVTWETCSLRDFLNDNFMYIAFSAEEQSAILTTVVDNSADQGYSGWNTKGGNNTEDKIFLLSYAEANRYLGVTSEDEYNTLSRVSPTEYAIVTGAWSSDFYQTADGEPVGVWWLRSPGIAQINAADVLFSGSFSDRYVDFGGNVIRPALWLDLESGIL